MISNLTNLLARKDLLRELVVTEMRTYSAHSKLGWLWWLLDPILMMLIYSAVVVGLLGRGLERYSPYPVFILCALIAWKHFSTASAQSTRVLSSREGLINAIPFPTMVLPLSQSLSGFAHFLFGFTVLLAMALLWPNQHHSGAVAPLVQIIPLIFLQLVVTIGACLPLACIGVLIPDLRNVMGHVLRIGFYLSPSLYGLDMVEDALLERVGGIGGQLLLGLYLLNPFAIIITGYRHCLFYGTFMPPHLWIMLIVEAAVLLCGGYLIYQYYDRRVIKYI